MPPDHKPDKPEPITQKELPAFLLWFFTHTGHAAHVDTWRASKEKPAPASPTAGDDDQ